MFCQRNFFINGPANLLNNDPKNLPDWVISEMWVLECFMSVDILLLNACPSLLSVIIHEANYFDQTYSNSFSELFLFYFWQQFSVFFSCVSDNFTLNLLYSTIYTNTESLLFLKKIIRLFVLIVQECNKSLQLHLSYQ